MCAGIVNITPVVRVKNTGRCDCQSIESVCARRYLCFVVDAENTARALLDP